MNLAMYSLPSNLKRSLHKTWQTLLLFLKHLQIQTLKRKKWGDMAYYNPTWKSGGHVPRVPHQIAPMQPIMTLVQITNYTSPNCTDRPQVNIHCIEHFFIVHDFWETCACPEKTELPWIFLLYWIYFLHSGFLTTCACPENRVSPEIFHCIVYPRNNLVLRIPCFSASYPQRVRVPPVKNHCCKVKQGSPTFLKPRATS